MITHNEQWLTLYPGTEYSCAEGRMRLMKSMRETAAQTSLFQE